MVSVFLLRDFICYFIHPRSLILLEHFHRNQTSRRPFDKKYRRYAGITATGRPRCFVLGAVYIGACVIIIMISTEGAGRLIPSRGIRVQHRRFHNSRMREIRFTSRTPPSPSPGTVTSSHSFQLALICTTGRTGFIIKRHIHRFASAFSVTDVAFYCM